MGITDRDLCWDGGYNVRDLGGLPTVDGRETARGAVLRSASPQLLTAQGWAALYEYGVRTIVDLRNDDELTPDAAPRPDGLRTVHQPLDGVEDTEFWDYWGQGRHGTPLYYEPWLDRFPQRAAAVVRTIAQAPPGGVLVHCGAGRDRTGIVTMLVLSLVGVPAEVIAADHDLCAERLRPLSVALGRHDEQPAIERILAEAGTTVAELIVTALAGLDVRGYLRGGGAAESDLDALRVRLLP
jgi:protein-tyrosine phosphatase